MRKLLTAMFVALLMVGCGEDDPMALRMIKKAKENNATKLHLTRFNMSDASPLKGLTNLEVLDLRHNQITDISPLAGLTKLKGLNLYNNQITDISPLKGLTSLKELGLGGNIITITPKTQHTNCNPMRLKNNSRIWRERFGTYRI